MLNDNFFYKFMKRKCTALKVNSPIEYVKKYSKHRDRDLKYDFMPKILEIIERPANPAGKVIIYGILSLLIVTIIWACLSKMDIVITTTGIVQPIGDLNVVQAYAGGTVSSINVTEGAYVEEGTILVELDTESLDINVSQLNEQREILEVQHEIYTKIINEEDLSLIIVTDYEEKLQTYVQAILDTDTSMHNAIDNLELEKQNAELNKQIAQVQLEEYQKGDSQTQITAQELVVKQYALELEQIELQLEDTALQYRVEVNAKLSEISNQISEIDNNIEQYYLSIEYQDLIAPVSGYVNSLNVNTIGEIVSAGQEIMTIVPADSTLEMVCYIKNMDIADVEVGMDVEVKLEAYPYNDFGTVKGKVKYISPSAFMNEQMGSVYLVKIELDEPDNEIEIISGLTGTVEIKTGMRTIMEYFMDPIVEGLDESLHEK